MKRILFSFIILLFTIQIYSQKDETVFGYSGIRLTGVWGGSTNMINNFEDDFDLDRGGFFSFELNKSLLLGWSNYDLRTYLNNGDLVRLRSHDFLIGYSPNSYRSFHPYFYTSIGNGRADLEGEGRDRILSIQPSAAIELNIFRWLRISAEGGYRFISGSDYQGITDEMLSGPFVGLRLKFGWSWGR